jgi:hypothetical protein
MWDMKNLLATCVLLAALASLSPVNALECRYGIITTGTDRYCAPPPDGGSGLTTQEGDAEVETTSDEPTLTMITWDVLRSVLSLL